MFHPLHPVATLIALVLAPSALAAEVPMPGEPIPVPFDVGTKTGDPLAHLPAGTRLILPFGERPVFSPDGRKIAYIGKSYGDAFEYDIATGATRNLTAHMPHKGFLRVHYMRNGSFILTGPFAHAEKEFDTRFKQTEIWWMDAKASRPAVRLGPILFEGVAVSAKSNRIAWVENSPHGLATGSKTATTTLKVADVMLDGRGASLANIRDLLTKPASECALEAQDFAPDDTSVTAPCYTFGDNRQIAVSLKDGSVTEFPVPKGLYIELEGILPDGKRSLIECGNQDHSGLDLCLLELRPDAPRTTRLSRAQDYGRHRFSNPQVSPDGRRIAFQFGSAADAPGVGRGILLMDLPRGF